MIIFLSIQHVFSVCEMCSGWTKDSRAPTNPYVLTGHIKSGGGAGEIITQMKKTWQGVLASLGAAVCSSSLWLKLIDVISGTGGTCQPESRVWRRDKCVWVFCGRDKRFWNHLLTFKIVPSWNIHVSISCLTGLYRVRLTVDRWWAGRRRQRKLHRWLETQFTGGTAETEMLRIIIKVLESVRDATGRHSSTELSHVL